MKEDKELKERKFLRFITVEKKGLRNWTPHILWNENVVVVDTAVKG